MGTLYFKVLPKEVTIIFIYLLLLFYIFKEVLEKLPRHFDTKDNCYFSLFSHSLSLFLTCMWEGGKNFLKLYLFIFTYTCIYSFSNSFRLLQNVEQSSLCYTVGSC